MSIIHDEKIRLLVKVSSLYYIDGLNQQEIASRLGISRPQVSRMLSAAKAEGIVQITIRNPYSEEQRYEKAIAETFGIHDCIVIQPSDADARMVDLHLGRAGATLLESVLKENDIVGVMAGRAIASLAEEMRFSGRKHLQFVPLVGGWGSEGSAWHANSNTRMMGEGLKAKYWFLNAPAIVGSTDAKEVLLKEKEIGDVLAMARQAKVAVVGIGQPTPNATIVRSGVFTEEEMCAVMEQGAVGNLCTTFINEKGEAIAHEAEQRMIGLSAAELRQIPNIIAIASGEEKVAAIAATLRGRWIDVLITDMATAKAVLEWHRSHPVS
ncbi:sugar-binding transcriptional regulator [Brevibacillus fluminis]|uniref:sugar-binding transcriptional regulator n=1 Tax=Brevibacillus fluminis TaxID=511487 RepID=UPI003F8C9412